METRTLLEPVEKYYFEVGLINDDLQELNREIRDWLGQNCECTWETKWIKDNGRYMDKVGVYFDLESNEEDMMAFKLRWM